MAEEVEQPSDAASEEVVADGEIEIRSEQEQQKFESDFAIKMVDTLVAINEQQISSYELPNRFFTTDELNCFGFFSNSVPVNPLPAVYPENGFLIFRGVPVPKSVNLTSANLEEIGYSIKSSISADAQGQQLSDLGSDMINAYQIATQIYNDRVEKIRISYLANVKNAKSQVMEISAAVVCAFVIILTLLNLT
ncbi:hypothetical protein N9567_02765 [Planktomarina temperata]|nr:hypothetical protein [bacterium]MDB4101024.1 hypothetical protein [Planktomarina temperata]MDC0930731.1 hypothetical protein [Planktomarina temperata]